MWLKTWAQFSNQDLVSFVSKQHTRKPKFKLQLSHLRTACLALASGLKLSLSLDLHLNTKP